MLNYSSTELLLPSAKLDALIPHSFLCMSQSKSVITDPAVNIQNMRRQFSQSGRRYLQSLSDKKEAQLCLHQDCAAINYSFCIMQILPWMVDRDLWDLSESMCLHLFSHHCNYEYWFGLINTEFKFPFHIIRVETQKGNGDHYCQLQHLISKHWIIIPCRH